MMGNYTLNRLRRVHLPFLIVLLFGGIMCTLLGSIHQVSIQKQAEFEHIYASIEVKCTVTNLLGNQTDHLNAPYWVHELFTGEKYFAGYLRDVQLKRTRHLGPPYDTGLSGITSIDIDKALWPDNGCTIFWNDGYDESVFALQEYVCLVPQTMNGGGTITVKLSNPYFTDKSVSMELKVIGYYTGPGEDIYCPWLVMVELHDSIEQSIQVDAASGILASNDKLDEFKALATEWFTEPDSSGRVVKWGKFGHEYYPNAMDINDSQLSSAEQNLGNDLKLLSLASSAALAVTLGAGLLVSFLMVRQRAKELALMQTLGTSKVSVFGQALGEQVLSLLPGILIGGIPYQWRPLPRVALLVVFYLAGACVGILLFLRRNLILALKEDQQ